MTANQLEVLSLVTSTLNDEKDDEYSIPLDISDIINICREYSKLTWQIRGQIEAILEVGAEEAIRSGEVNKTSLPHIKYFLQRICDNAYFGDAASQAKECIKLIQQYEDKHKITFASSLN
jgi:hypothetical protein